MMKPPTDAVGFVKRVSLLVLAFLVLTSSITPIVHASSGPLPPSERQALNQYTNWVANSCSTDSSGAGIDTTSLTPGAGAPDGSEFPSLDPTSMANAINTFISKEQSSSPLKNLGATIVNSAKASNVSPFLIVAIAENETTLGTANTKQVTEAHNIFDRAATSSQPHISLPPVQSGQPSLWYKWTSVEASVDSTAKENQNASGGGDIAAYLRNQYGSGLNKGDLVSFSAAYDSSQDAQQYANDLTPSIEAMVKDAGAVGTGSPAGTPGGGSPITSGGSSSGCCPDSGSTSTVSASGTTVTGDTTKPPSAVQKVVWDTLTSGGIDAMHAAAVMGNIAHEGVWDPENSSENPSAPPDSQDPTVTGPHYGYGLIGWTPGQSLLDQMSQAGINGKPYTAETQAAVILAEIQGKTKTYPASIGDQFLHTKTIQQAVIAYQGNHNPPPFGPGGPYLGFERPQYESGPNGTINERTASAQQFLKELGGSSPTAPPSDSGSGSGSCCPTGAGATASGGDNETTIWNYLVGTMQLSAIQAAGIMGNIDQESGFSPTATNPSSGAYGIIQWLGNREAGLESYATSQGKDKSDITIQLQYMQQELEGSYKSSVLQPIQNANDLQGVLKIWLIYYEAPCDSSDTACIDGEVSNRLPDAKAVLQKYGGGTVDATGSGDACAGASASGTAGADGWDLKGPNAMVYYWQCDPKWANHPYGAGKSSICVGGCGITSSAMVVATLADKSQTPETLADKYGAAYHGDGTSFALYPVLAKDFGLKERDIGLDFGAAAATVKAGGLVIIAVNPGHFTSEGHVMVIRAVTSDGKFLLADPYNEENKAMGRGDTNNTPYTAAYLEGPGAAMEMFAFTK